MMENNDGRSLRAEPVMNQAPAGLGHAVTVSNAWQPIETAPKDGTQILAEILTGYFQVVSWFDGQWRENTNSLALRQPPKQWMEIKATARPVVESDLP